MRSIAKNSFDPSDLPSRFKNKNVIASFRPWLAVVNRLLCLYITTLVSTMPMWVKHFVLQRQFMPNAGNLTG